jgi:hypothetical protein
VIGFKTNRSFTRSSSRRLEFSLRHASGRTPIARAIDHPSPHHGQPALIGRHTRLSHSDDPYAKVLLFRVEHFGTINVVSLSVLLERYEQL